MKVNLHFKGSSTSGNHGHAGRPGHRGGSAPKGGGTAAPKTETSSAALEPHDIAQAIQIAYEISDASGGETTDAGEAARIFSERTGKKLTDAQVQQIEEAVNNEFKVENYDSQLVEEKRPVAAPTTVTRPIRSRELTDKLGIEGGSTELRSGVPKSVMDLLPYGITIPNDDKNVFTFGRSFFYRHGNSGESFAASVEKKLNDAGYNAETLHSGEHYYPGFVGGAKLFSARDSFFYSVVRVTRK